MTPDNVRLLIIMGIIAVMIVSYHWAEVRKERYRAISRRREGSQGHAAEQDKEQEAGE